MITLLMLLLFLRGAREDMITIFYHYYNKKENKMKEASRVFDDVNKAIKFCWSMKDRKMILDGWSCYDIEDHELMNAKVNMSIINGWSI